MSIKERLQLIEAIWQTMDEEVLKEDEHELSILQERLEEYKADPTNTISFEEFKDRMLKKHGGK